MFMVKTSGIMAPSTRNAEASNCGTRLQSLYHMHEWFHLRDAVYGLRGHGFFSGAVACAFNDFPKCLNYLLPVIESNPRSHAAHHAHDLLVWTYMRQGKFHSDL